MKWKGVDEDLLSILEVIVGEGKAVVAFLGQGPPKFHDRYVADLGILPSGENPTKGTRQSILRGFVVIGSGSQPAIDDGAAFNLEVLAHPFGDVIIGSDETAVWVYTEPCAKLHRLNETVGLELSNGDDGLAEVSALRAFFSQSHRVLGISESLEQQGNTENQKKLHRASASTSGQGGLQSLRQNT
jgi:hypothetical protein